MKNSGVSTKSSEITDYIFFNQIKINQPCFSQKELGKKTASTSANQTELFRIPEVVIVMNSVLLY